MFIMCDIILLILTLIFFAVIIIIMYYAAKHNDREERKKIEKNLKERYMEKKKDPVEYIDEQPALRKLLAENKELKKQIQLLYKHLGVVEIEYVDQQEINRLYDTYEKLGRSYIYADCLTDRIEKAKKAKHLVPIEVYNKAMEEEKKKKEELAKLNTEINSVYEDYLTKPKKRTRKK